MELIESWTRPRFAPKENSTKIPIVAPSERADVAGSARPVAQKLKNTRTAPALKLRFREHPPQKPRLIGCSALRATCVKADVLTGESFEENMDPPRQEPFLAVPQCLASEVHE